MKHYILVFLIIFSSFSYSHEIKTVIVELNGMDYVNDDYLEMLFKHVY